MSNYEFERFGEASLITRTTNDVIQSKRSGNDFTDDADVANYVGGRRLHGLPETIGINGRLPRCVTGAGNFCGPGNVLRGSAL